MPHRLIIFITFSIASTIPGSYWDERARIILQEQQLILGSELKLNEKEMVANECLMQLKAAEIEEGMINPDKFLPSQNFMKVKDKIDKSGVFKIIRKLPKGAILHVHDVAMASTEYVYNLTFRDNLYGCIKHQRLDLSFLIDDECQWKPLREFRSQNHSFNEFLRTQISIIRNDPDGAFPNEKLAWKAFSGAFKSISMLICYKPVFIDYIHRALLEMYEDNVMYVEIRASLFPVYDSKGIFLSPLQMAQLYLNITKDFKKNHPGFLGLKIIYTASRHDNRTEISNFLRIAKTLTEKFPDVVVGFDLAGGEEKGHTLRYLAEELLATNGTIKFFFHAAETKWHFASTDLNIVDAILLNSSRIGHGYALTWHSEVLRLIKDRNVPVEINPISNQVLGLVKDVRNHPGGYLISQNFSVVISNDDPGMWGASGLSYDWYYAFMGMSPVSADLRLLKKLAINSIRFSALTEKEKIKALEMWLIKWNDFVATLSSTKCHSAKTI